MGNINGLPSHCYDTDLAVFNYIMAYIGKTENEQYPHECSSKYIGRQVKRLMEGVDSCESRKLKMML